MDMDTGKQLYSPDQSNEPPLGAHLVTPRRGYCHHGIYVGEGRVVHYAGLCRSKLRGPIEEVSLGQFAAGHTIWVDMTPASKYGGTEVVRRARSRIGENHYRLLTNNCEHFCMWCLYGENRSGQVESWLVHPLVALRYAFSLLLGIDELRPDLIRGCAIHPS